MAVRNLMQHFLYFFFDPHGQGSLRPMSGRSVTGSGAKSKVVAADPIVPSSVLGGSGTGLLPCSGRYHRLQMEHVSPSEPTKLFSFGIVQLQTSMLFPPRSEVHEDAIVVD